MGTTSEKLTYLGVTKDKLKTVINAIGGEIDDDTFRSYPETLNDLVLKSINGEIDLYDEYPKKQSTGTNITIEGVESGKAEIELNPSELSQATTPTPSTPIPIKKITGNNSITVRAKNLFNKTTATANKYINTSGGLGNSTNYYASDYIEVNASKIYVSGSGENAGTIRSASYDENKTFIEAYTQAKSGFALTLPNNAKYIRISVRNDSLDTAQVEQNATSPTTYEPYQSQTYPINLGSLEYCKIGDYSDEFYLDNGNWYIRKNIGKVVLDGTENWSYQTTQTRFRWQWTLGTRSNLGYCYSYVVDVNLTNDFTISIQNSNIFIKDSRYTTSTSFKEWLSTNNVYFYYVLSTPTSEAITDTTLIEQLNNLYNQIKSYKGQTNITQANAELPFEITISALKELDI